MNSYLLNRESGSISPQNLVRAQNARLLASLAPADNIHFCLHSRDPSKLKTSRSRQDVAHDAGVNSIAIDRFEGRYLVSGGADSSLAVWDLESCADADNSTTIHLPLVRSIRTAITQSLGITHVSFYPFDSLALLTSGYDHTLKLFASETLQESASFDVGSIVYSHATSSIASHLLVACASQHPTVRLADLRSGANTHSLAGHAGSVLTVSWHPKDENVLASGATDGVIRLWDIRRSASSLGVLDVEDNIGIAGYDGKGSGARRRERGKSHSGAVNGLVWSEDGAYLVSNGHDERMRVWNMLSGANTLVNFGPGLKNATTTVNLPLVVPRNLTPIGKDTVLYPNPRELLGFDLHSGKLQHRLRIKSLPGFANSQNPKERTTSLAWRAYHVELYSAHGDGTIRCWKPRTAEDVLADEENEDDRDPDQDASERKRKREEFDEIVRDLTTRKITFS